MSNASLQSSASDVGDKHEMATLTNYGVAVEECFTGDEIMECAEGHTDAAHTAHAFEEELKNQSDAVRERVVQLLQDKALHETRMKLLRGEMGVQDFLYQLNDPFSEVSAAVQKGDSGGAAVDASQEEADLDVTREYECPECGTKAAHQSVLVVSREHELEEETLLTCVNCGKKWTP
jgi:DNA-directed RNA polymerase subunit M/transcription elongation factor TFIIS